MNHDKERGGLLSKKPQKVGLAEQDVIMTSSIVPQKGAELLMKTRYEPGPPKSKETIWLERKLSEGVTKIGLTEHFITVTSSDD